MTEIIPFHGTRFNAATAGEIGRLIAPPYDVINPTLREALYHQSEYNIARITKAERAPGAAPYEPAAGIWRAWRQAGVVTRDPVAGFYVYEQFFRVHDQALSRTALIALVRIRQPGDGILPHENTLAGPRADRLELLRATRTHFGLVFGIYADPPAGVDALLDPVKTTHPLAHASDRENQLHRLWAITAPDEIAEIRRLVQEKEILIADGHHRYETALNYRNEHPEDPAAQYVMIALVNASHSGLVVLPTHRLVKGTPGFHPGRFLVGLHRNFNVRTYPGDSAAVRAAVLNALRAYHERGEHVFGAYLGDGNHYILSLRGLDRMNGVSDRSEAWRRLDVAILHSLILEDALRITPEAIQKQEQIEYVQDFPHTLQDAAEQVQRGKAQALFLLNPTPVDEVLAVAHHGERMPQKSTFFYPKVYTGMVMDCLDDSLKP